MSLWRYIILVILKLWSCISEEKRWLKYVPIHYWINVNVFVLKVMGSLAVQKPKEGHRVSGVLIKRGFNYHLVDPKDLASEYNFEWLEATSTVYICADYTELATSTITEVSVS